MNLFVGQWFTQHNNITYLNFLKVKIARDQIRFQAAEISLYSNIAACELYVASSMPEMGIQVYDFKE